MSAQSTPRFVRLQVELVVEVTDQEELASGALDRVNSDQYLPQEERGHAVAAIKDDPAEALAYLVDPFALVEGIPGVELAQASWQCSHADYDADADDWDPFGEEEEEEVDETDR